MEGQIDATTQPQVVSTRTSSASLRRFSDDLGEHADTPMRKRPRLGSDAEGDKRPTQNEASEHAPNNSLAGALTHRISPGREAMASALVHTPSRVTLNLRSPDSSPCLQNRKKESIWDWSCETPDAARSEMSISPETLIMHDLSPNSDSSEAVEIEVGDPEDIYPGQDPDVGVVNEDLDMTLERALQILDLFPPDNSGSMPLDKATWYANLVAKESTQLELPLLLQISTWLRESWLPQVPRSHFTAYAIYSHHRDFWATLAQIYTKFLSRKTLTTDFAPRSIGSPHVKRLLEFLRSCFSLCLSIVSADLNQIQQSGPHAILQADLISSRHLKCVHQLFWHHENVPLWRVLNEGFRLDADRIQRDLAVQVFLDNPHTFNKLALLAQLFMTDASTIAKHRHELESIVGLLRFIHGHLRNHQSEASARGPQNAIPGLSQLQENLLGVAKSLEQMLLRSAKKQVSQLPNDIIVTLADHCSFIVFDVACTNRGSVTSFFRPDFDIGEEDVSEATPQQVQTCTMLRFAWQFLTMGRMELRVHSLDWMGNSLVSYWKYANATVWQDENARRAYFAPVALWMRKSKVVEYICGVESHPQLINRSSHVLGFLFVTHSWDDDLTDTIWNAIQQTPDPRICAALWDVLGQSTTHMEAQVLVDSCQKLAELPTENFSEEMIIFVEALSTTIGPFLVSNHDLHRSFSDDMTQTVLAAYTRLVCDTAEGVGQLKDERLRQKIHGKSLHWVEMLVRQTRDPHRVHLMYNMCLEHVRAHSRQSLGSLEIIFTLTRFYQDDLGQPISTVALSETVAEEICLFIDAIKDTHLSTYPPPGLESRLVLLPSLICHPSSTELPDHLQQRLWTHLVGDAACNSESRDAAWPVLCRIARQAAEPRPMIDHWIHRLLPTLSPEIFRPGMLDFLVSAMAYVQRLKWPQGFEEDQAIEIPLADVWWRIILVAPKNTVEDTAIQGLSRSHVEEAFIHDASVSSVTATHTALIEQCIAQLDAVADLLPRSSDRADDNLLLADIPGCEGTSDYHLRFKRTLRFMKRFILDVRGDPKFRSASSVASSPSMAPPSSEVNGDRTEICYQVFGPGVHDSEIKKLKMNSSATFAELYMILQKCTKFTSMSFIHGGAFLDVANKPEQSIEPIVGKGLLLVLNKDRNAILHAFSKGPGLSAAERAVLDHFDRLYDFLDLDQSLSQDVSAFLLLLPPNSRIRETVLQHSVSFTTLFPPQNFAKRLYSLHTLKAELTQQQGSGTVDEAFLVRAIQLLAEGLTTTLDTPMPSPIALNFAQQLVDCLVLFLKERPIHESVASHLPDGSAFARCLYQMLENQSLGVTPVVDGTTETTYACLVEASLHSIEVWKTFQNAPNISALHRWLLVRGDSHQQRLRIRQTIETVCTNASSPAGISSFELCRFYWSALSPSIASLHNEPLQVRDFLGVVAFTFSQHARALTDEAGLRRLLSFWTELLSTYDHVELPGSSQTDQFLEGIVHLLSLCISSLKSFKKPLHSRRLLELLFSRFLFPTVVDPTHSDGPQLSPILDLSTRKQTYYVISSACEDSPCCYWIVDQLLLLSSEGEHLHDIPWNADRSRWLRASIGYSGLRNLTNTCYMNSLVAQLFMNDEFRRFMMNSDRKGDHVSDLLAETQMLFAHMQESNGKFADTENFAHAIKPYETDHIDVTVQMDVDEFYNLLFDRWEDHMPSLASKQAFRSFYGGQSVMQIKSKDCEHVSERVEPFFTIQCEVKGKTDLQDSLKSYIEGDVMEGDNKYKCESCGGRFVDAVKRSCLKNIPDNLIFHLKRFDFDLTTFLRSKINDHFGFPEQIDMTPFSVDFINDPTSGGGVHDMFELVGVLVHAGTAETGHYYSYIRLPDGGDSLQSRWAEFNDTEVAEFDKSKIPDTCFGGPQMTNGEANWQKPWNAYMLFYRRVADTSTEGIAYAARHHAGEPDHPASVEISANIVAANQRNLRRYCLFDPSHAGFVQGVMGDLMLRRSGACSGDHNSERSVLTMALRHATAIFSHMKSSTEFEVILQQISKFASKCADCCAFALHWIADNPATSENLLLASPVQIVRLAWSDFISSLLNEHRKLDIEGYGLVFDSDDPDDFSGLVPLKPYTSLAKILGLLLTRLLPSLGRHVRAWDEFFGLLSAVADLGLQEVAILLDSHVLVDVLEILRLDRTRPPPRAARYHDLHEHVSRAKRSLPVFGLARLLHRLLTHVDPCESPATSSSNRLQEYNDRDQRFPLLNNEYRLIRETLDHTEHLTMIMRIVELWVEQDIIDEPHYPSGIVQNLLICALGEDSGAVRTGHANVDEDFERSIRDTLIACVSDYELTWIGPSLDMSLTYLRHCSSDETGTLVIRAVATAASGLLKSTVPRSGALNYMADYENQGGAKILDFLRQSSDVVNPRCGHQVEPDEGPFLPAVIKTTPDWAPGMLIFETKEVRASTALFLSKIIFDRYPDILSGRGASDSGADGDDELDILDALRVQAVRALYNQCARAISHAGELRLPKRFVYEIGGIVAQCASWCNKIQFEERGPLASAAKSDDRSVLQRYQSLREALADWSFEMDPDDAITDTEWASDLDDSDALTEI